MRAASALVLIASITSLATAAAIDKRGGGADGSAASAPVSQGHQVAVLSDLKAQEAEIREYHTKLLATAQNSKDADEQKLSTYALIGLANTLSKNLKDQAIINGTAEDQQGSDTDSTLLVEVDAEKRAAQLSLLMVKEAWLTRYEASLTAGVQNSNDEAKKKMFKLALDAVRESIAINTQNQAQVKAFDNDPKQKAAVLSQYKAKEAELKSSESRILKQIEESKDVSTKSSWERALEFLRTRMVELAEGRVQLESILAQAE